MASRFNNIIGANQYQPLPLDSLMKIGLARDEETQSLYDKYNSKLSSVGMIPTSNTWDENKVKSIVDDRNKTLSDIAKYDITTPEGEQKVRGLINELSTNQDLIKAANNTAAHKQAVEWLQKNSENTYNPNLYAPGSYFDNYEKYDQSGKGDVSNFMPPMEYQDESKFGLDVVKAIDPSTIKGLSYDENTDSWSSSTGVTPTQITNAILGAASPKMVKQWHNEYYYQNGELPTEEDFSKYVLQKAQKWGQGYNYEKYDYNIDKSGNNSSGNSGGSNGGDNDNSNSELPVISYSNKTDVLPKTTKLTHKQVGFSGGEPSAARVIGDYNKYQKSPSYEQIPNYSEFNAKQSGILEKIIDGETLRDDIADSKYKSDLKLTYQKYKEDKPLSKEEQTKMSHMIDNTNSWINQHGEDKTSYRNYALKETDGIIYTQPFNKLPYQSYKYYDPTTGEVISGDKLPSNLDPQSTNSIVAGKMYGAAGFDRNSNNEIGFSNGYRVLIDDKKGGYKEYIMQNPNKNDADNKYEGFANDAKMFENQWNTIEGGYKLFYEPNTNIFKLKTPDGEDYKVTDGKTETDKIPPQNIKQLLDHIYNTKSQEKPQPKSTQFKQVESQSDNELKITGDLSTKSDSIAFKNNNPGNIRSVGGGFKSYDTIEEGYNDLTNYIQRAMTGKHKAYDPNESLLDFCKTYSPKSDGNDPVAKANIIAKDLGVSLDTPISKLLPKLQDFVKSLIKTEDNKMYQTLFG